MHQMNHLKLIRQLEAARNPGAWQRLEFDLDADRRPFVIECRMCFWPSPDGRRAYGYWALTVVEGAYAGIPLEGLNAAVFYEIPDPAPGAPWRRAIHIDSHALRTQRFALERILTGQAGGGFAKLERRVGERMATRFVPIDFTAARGRTAARSEAAGGLPESCLPCAAPAVSLAASA